MVRIQRVIARALAQNEARPFCVGNLDLRVHQFRSTKGRSICNPTILPLATTVSLLCMYTF